MIGGSVTWARHENEDYGASALFYVMCLHPCFFEGQLQAVKIAFKSPSNTCPKKMKPKLDGLTSNTV